MFQTTNQWSNGDVATANLIRWDQWQHPQLEHHRDWLNDWIGLMEDKPWKTTGKPHISRENHGKTGKTLGFQFRFSPETNPMIE